ncbi:MAG: hypothetical protein IKU15_04650 [Clostridia bacterium]|nr:hypothetical protein [Clostridia bacterium]
MNKIIKSFILTFLIVCLGTGFVYSEGINDSFMEFTLPNDWYIFSKNMEDDALLDAANITKEDINKILTDSDCEYYMINPAKKSEIYVKVKKNDFSLDIFNISLYDNENVLDNLDRILYDFFLMDGFDYKIEDVIINDYSQFKFITVPGTFEYNGEKHGMVLGTTFVNGNGIGFMLYLEDETANDEYIKTMLEIAETLSFTVIKNKTDTDIENGSTSPVFDAKTYIVSGMGAVLFVALCIYLFGKIKSSEKNDEINQKTEDKISD